MLNVQEGVFLITGFGAVLLFCVWYVHKRKGTKTDAFLIANRNVSTIRGALSIAAAWIWAPAVFICCQKAYEQGIAGVFWFTAPNILCFFVFAPFAVRLRKYFPNGYSLPDFIYYRYKNKSLHLASLLVYMGYQLGAIIINCTAGGILLSLLTALPYMVSVLLMAGVALSYTLISGLRASVLTDVIQMILILSIAFVLVPWVTITSGGFHMIKDHIGGVTGEYKDVFNPTVAFGFGIASTIGLISGPFADQMFYQRTFAVKKNSVRKVFIYGGLIFGVVPIMLSVLGFVAAGSPGIIAEVNRNPGVNAQMVGPIAIGYYLPKWALMAHAVLCFSGLSSTLDSSFCAISSLATVDIYKRYINPDAAIETLLKVGRFSMLLLGAIGVAVALLQPKLIWVFLIYGALASAAFFPAFLSIYWKRLTAKAAMWAILLSILLGTPLSIYANIKDDATLIVISAVASISIGLVVCLLFGLNNKNSYDFDNLKNEEVWSTKEHLQEAR